MRGTRSRYFLSARVSQRSAGSTTWVSAEMYFSFAGACTLMTAPPRRRFPTRSAANGWALRRDLTIPKGVRDFGRRALVRRGVVHLYNRGHDIVVSRFLIPKEDRDGPDRTPTDRSRAGLGRAVLPRPRRG